MISTMARSKLTPERQRKIVDAIAAGNYDTVAAAAGGISRETFYAWMRRGEEGQSQGHRRFFEAVERARATAEIDAVACIRRAWKGGDWRAAAEFLRRRYPNRWGTAERVELDSSPVPEPKSQPRERSVFSRMDPEEAQAFGRYLAQRETWQSIPR
jgi:hypothetical protein